MKSFKKRIQNCYQDLLAKMRLGQCEKVIYDQLAETYKPQVIRQAEEILKKEIISLQKKGGLTVIVGLGDRIITTYDNKG